MSLSSWVDLISETCGVREVIMAGYDLDNLPFSANQDTHVRLFKGQLRENHRPIVCKRHELYIRPDMMDIPDLTKVVHAGLVQARVKHPNVCQLLEIRIDLNSSETSYFVDHVMESLEKDLAKDITERSESKRFYSEGKLWGKMLQTSSALQSAHEKVTYM